MAALKLPHTAQEVLPFAILFGTMLAFWRLTRNNELVVARAAGVSVWQFLTPAVLVALLIGIIAVTVFNPIASFTEAAYEKLESHVLRQGSDQLSLSNAGLWLRQSDPQGNQIIIHAGKIGSQQLVLDPVTLFFFNDSTQFTSRIDAQTARLENGDWLIENGIRWVPDEPPEPFDEFRLATTLTPRKIEESFASPDTMSFWDLPGFIALLEQSGFPAQRHRLHFNVLLARPFLLCAMVLVAATFSLRMQRRGGATLMIVGGVDQRVPFVFPVRRGFCPRAFRQAPGHARRLDADRSEPDFRRLDAAPSGRRLMPVAAAQIAAAVAAWLVGEPSRCAVMVLRGAVLPPPSSLSAAARSRTKTRRSSSAPTRSSTTISSR